MRCLLTLPVVCAGLALPGVAQEARVRQPVNGVAERVVVQTVLGGLGAAGGGVAGCAAGARLEGDSQSDSPGLGGCILGGLAGWALGSAVGIQLGGQVGQGQADFVSTLTGTVFGTAAFLMIRGAANLDPDYTPFWVAAVIVPVAGGIIGYNASDGARRRGPSVGVGTSWAGGPALAVRVRF